MFSSPRAPKSQDRPCASGHAIVQSSCRCHVSDQHTMPASKKSTTQFMLAHLLAASTQKGVGIRPHHLGRGHASTIADIQKRDGARRHRSLVVELEHVGLHLLGSRPLPWRHGVEIHLHDLHPGHHARESHFFRLGLGIGSLDL